MLTKEKDFKLCNTDTNITFSVHNNNLLFIHAPFLSSQWELNKVGVQIMLQPKSVSIGIMSNDGNAAYQNWFIEKHQFDDVLAYFRSLGYPCPNPDPMGEAKKPALKLVESGKTEEDHPFPPLPHPLSVKLEETLTALFKACELEDSVTLITKSEFLFMRSMLIEAFDAPHVKIKPFSGRFCTHDVESGDISDAIRGIDFPPDYANAPIDITMEDREKWLHEAVERLDRNARPRG